MKYCVLGISIACLILAAGSTAQAGINTITSSTMWFRGSITPDGSGGYTGTIPMIDEGVDVETRGDGISGFDVYGKNGVNARFGDDPGSGPVVWTSQAIGADHDAWPTWNPDTPDWYQYSVEFTLDGKWSVRNHPGATAANPWSSGGFIARGVPMSGTMNWTTLFAAETDIGAYLPGTGTSEIPGGAATQGGGAQAWDMDWSWGSEAVPLEYPGFAVGVFDNGDGTFDVSLTPAVPVPGAFLLGAMGLGMVGWMKRRKKEA